MTKKNLFLILVLPVLIFIVLRFPSFYESYWYGDEGIYAGVGHQLVDGKKLYQEVWDHKPPFIYLLFSGADLLGWPEGLIFLKGLSVILGILTIILVNKIFANRVEQLPRFIGLIFLSLFLGSTILEGNVVNAEIIFILFNLLGFFLLLKEKHFGLIGLLFYLSLMTKIPGTVEFGLILFIFIGVYLKEEGINSVIKKIVSLALGFFVPLTITLGFFYFQGTLSDFIYANITFNVFYSVDKNNFTYLAGLNIPNTIIKLLSYAAILVYTWYGYLKRKLSKIGFLVINLFGAQFLSSLLSGKNYGHYFIQILPGASLVIGLILEKLKRIDFKKRLNIAQLKYSFGLLAMFFPLFIVMKGGGKIGSYAPFHQYYTSFFRGYLLNQEKAKDNFWWRNGEEVKNTKDFVEYFSQSYPENEQVYLYTDKPWLAALTEKKLTNKYIVWFHLEYRKKHLEEEIENIARSDLVVIDKEVSILDPILSEVKANFEKVDNFKNFDIYKLSSDFNH